MTDNTYMTIFVFAIFFKGRLFSDMIFAFLKEKPHPKDQLLRKECDSSLEKARNRHRANSLKHKYWPGASCSKLKTLLSFH